MMRRLIGEPAPSLAAAVRDSSRPVVLAPGSPAPAYPPSLWSAGIAGKVLVELLVDSSGRADLTTVDVLYSDNPQFTRAVREALPKMQFIPAIVGGQPQSQLLRLPFVFAPERRSR
jgi:TonB family protein